MFGFFHTPLVFQSLFGFECLYHYRGDLCILSVVSSKTIFKFSLSGGDYLYPQEKFCLYFHFQLSDHKTSRLQFQRNDQASFTPVNNVTHFEGNGGWR